MLKKFIPTVLSVFVLSILCVLSAPAVAVTLKIATISPEGSMWMEKMRAGAKEVAEKTGNRVKFKFYPGGVMGNDKAVLRKIRIGQLQGGALVAGSLSPFFPANQIYGQPMKFKSQAEVDYVREYMDSFITEGLEKAGFVTFGSAAAGLPTSCPGSPLKVWLTSRSARCGFPITTGSARLP